MFVVFRFAQLSGAVAVEAAVGGVLPAPVVPPVHLGGNGNEELSSRDHTISLIGDQILNALPLRDCISCLRTGSEQSSVLRAAAAQTAHTRATAPLADFLEAVARDPLGQLLGESAPDFFEQLSVSTCVRVGNSGSCDEQESQGAASAGQPDQVETLRRDRKEETRKTEWKDLEARPRAGDTKDGEHGKDVTRIRAFMRALHVHLQTWKDMVVAGNEYEGQRLQGASPPPAREAGRGIRLVSPWFVKIDSETGFPASVSDLQDEEESRRSYEEAIFDYAEQLHEQEGAEERGEDQDSWSTRAVWSTFSSAIALITTHTLFRPSLRELAYHHDSYAVADFLAPPVGAGEISDSAQGAEEQELQHRRLRAQSRTIVRGDPSLVFPPERRSEEQYKRRIPLCGGLWRVLASLSSSAGVRVSSPPPATASGRAGFLAGGKCSKISKRDLDERPRRRTPTTSHPLHRQVAFLRGSSEHRWGRVELVLQYAQDHWPFGEQQEHEGASETDDLLDHILSPGTVTPTGRGFHPRGPGGHTQNYTPRPSPSFSNAPLASSGGSLSLSGRHSCVSLAPVFVAIAMVPLSVDSSSPAQCQRYMDRTKAARQFLERLDRKMRAVYEFAKLRAQEEDVENENAFGGAGQNHHEEARPPAAVHRRLRQAQADAELLRGSSISNRAQTLRLTHSLLHDRQEISMRSVLSPCETKLVLEVCYHHGNDPRGVDEASVLVAQFEFEGTSIASTSSAAPSSPLGREQLRFRGVQFLLRPGPVAEWEEDHLRRREGEESGWFSAAVERIDRRPALRIIPRRAIIGDEQEEEDVDFDMDA